MNIETTGNPSVAAVSDSAELEKRIGQRAQELYEARGREDGHELADWLRAEAEIAGTRHSPELNRRIGQRAQELYEARGREDGHELADWLRAEAEIVGSEVVSDDETENLAAPVESPAAVAEELIAQPAYELYVTEGQPAQDQAGVVEEIVVTQVAVVGSAENLTRLIESGAAAPEDLIAPRGQDLYETTQAARELDGRACGEEVIVLSETAAGVEGTGNMTAPVESRSPEPEAVTGQQTQQQVHVTPDQQTGQELSRAGRAEEEIPANKVAAA